MTIRTVAVTAFAGQRPGTSGLRQKVRVFREPGYVEAFVQSLFEALPEAVGEGVAGKTLAWAATAASSTRGDPDDTRLAAANGSARMLVGRGGILSTPATSLIRGGALAGSSSAPATIPAAPTAISASNTMSPMAARRRSR